MSKLYNLLLQCFYETNRYELAMELARTLLDVVKDNMCFENNYYISCVMQNIGQIIIPNVVLKSKNSKNCLGYNYDLILEEVSSHNYEKKPTLKSKLLFMDFRFNNFKPGTIYCTATNLTSNEIGEMSAPIIKIGRSTFPGNDIKVPGGTSISRRNSVIINCKDDVWLYDLESTGTYLNEEKVIGKVPLIGKNTIRIGNAEYELTNDKDKLL